MAELIVHERLPKYFKNRRLFRAREYRKLFRFDKENVEWMANHFLGESVETRGGALLTIQQMEIFLRSLGDPDFQTGVGSDIGVHQSTVSKTIKYVINKILEKQNIWIRFPQTADAVGRAQEGWNIPGVIGAIDCVHIRIIKPVQGEEYFNRKGFCSVNVQATCSFTERFTSVDASWPGSVHDSRIWKNSEICNIMTDNIYNVALLGDEGYSLAPWLLTPYRRALTIAERNYNRWHKNNRCVIERCFGQLKRRFPMIHYTVRLKTNRVCRYIVCAFVLHNIAKHLNDPDDDFDELPIQQDPVYIHNDEDQNVIRQRGVNRRNAVAMELLRFRERR